MNLSKLKAGMLTLTMGRTILFFRELSSTNDIAKELALQGAAEGTVTVAETQIRGRGRIEREWFSPKGGLWFSIILRPKISPKDAPKLTLMMSVAVAHALSKMFDLATEIKWPNDVLVKNKKICGILTEANTRGNQVQFVIIGVGVNANFDVRDMPFTLQPSSTTLKEELNKEINLEALLRTLL